MGQFLQIISMSITDWKAELNQVHALKIVEEVGAGEGERGDKYHPKENYEHLQASSSCLKSVEKSIKSWASPK